MTTRQHTEHLAPAATFRATPGHPYYATVIGRQFNKRFTGRPDYVRRVASPDHVIRAVQEAVDEGQRLVVTSGGHCLEGFVSDPDVGVIIDISPMTWIYYDADRRAIAVEAGATVGDVYRALFQMWGTVIPLGEYPGIGMGGHVVGGAFGFLCRQLGLAADYLYGVEVVTVDQEGRAKAVVATRSPSDPNRELWWAHTGAGGGNLGVVTRYWFRSPGASGHDPAALLPRAPASISTFTTAIEWATLGRASFGRLLRNHGMWSEQHGGPSSPYASLWTLLEVHRQQFGRIVIRGVSTSGTAADAEARDYVAAVCQGVQEPPRIAVSRMSWLDFALNPFPDLFTMPPGGVSMKGKDALLKKRLTDEQIGIAYEHLTRTDTDVMGGMLALATYGGRVNTVAPDATASPHRHAIFDLACTTGWQDAADEAKNLAWVRAFYGELLASTGGAPVPGDAYDGALINHPDVDLADPTYNTSGVPWYTCYYQANYPRLQRVKAAWDPRNVFRHALSIRAAHS